MAIEGAFQRPRFFKLFVGNSSLPKGGVITAEGLIVMTPSFFKVTVYFIIIVIFKFEWRPLATDAKISVIVTFRRGRYKKSSVKNDEFTVISEIKMTEIERILNNGMVLWNIIQF